MSEQVEYFELTKVAIAPARPGEFGLATAAVLSCKLCGDPISGMGGPGHGAVCMRCAEVVVAGRAVGAIKWEDR